MGTKHVATLCGVSGVGGLRRLKSCDFSGECDICQPKIAMFVVV